MLIDVYDIISGRIKCNHEEADTLTNIYGDRVNKLSTSKMTVRSIRKCKKCSKVFYSEELDENCTAVNWNI